MASREARSLYGNEQTRCWTEDITAKNAPAHWTGSIPVSRTKRHRSSEVISEAAALRAWTPRGLQKRTGLGARSARAAAPGRCGRTPLRCRLFDDCVEVELTVPGLRTGGHDRLEPCV